MLNAQTPETVFLEELTWPVVREAIDSVTTTVIIPTGGVEQNGPHMALGKHNFRMTVGAERVARELGDTLVAPTIAYVPEGDIDPPSGHMRFAGTISIPEDVFKAVLEYSARSLKQHGFTEIVFIGDSGGNQPGMEEVANLLNEEWSAESARVLFVSDWYSSPTFTDWLLEQGYAEEEIGRHAGLSDTSLLLAVTPQHVRLGEIREGLSFEDGVAGDPVRSSPEIGQRGMDLGHDAAMRQLRQLLSNQ